jgi:NADP-dependent 3-hydroxy acid dehydrogenase YdfG
MNRVILITGASSGIGAATARLLAGTWRLALVARRGDRLAEVEAAVRGSGGECVVIPADLREPGAPAQAVQTAVRRFGALDAVVNNAGLFATAPAAEGGDDLWTELFALNLLAAVRTVRAAVPHLRASRGGSVVNISSVVADHAFPGCAAYTASKCALEGWSRTLREELRPDRIRVSVVAPGATDTEALRRVIPADPTRLCQAEDVASAIRFVLEQPVSASVDRLVVAPPAGPL